MPVNKEKYKFFKFYLKSLQKSLQNLINKDVTLVGGFINETFIDGKSYNKFMFILYA